MSRSSKGRTLENSADVGLLNGVQKSGTVDFEHTTKQLEGTHDLDPFLSRHLKGTDSHANTLSIFTNAIFRKFPRNSKRVLTETFKPEDAFSVPDICPKKIQHLNFVCLLACNFVITSKSGKNVIKS